MKHETVPAHISSCSALPLDGAQLREALLSMGTMDGLYLPPFTFQGRMGDDGTLWGRNNFGVIDEGTWQIEGDHLHLYWRGGWDDTVTQGCRDGDVLHFFDTGSGVWRMSLAPAAAQR